MIRINPRAIADIERIKGKLIKAGRDIQADSNTKVQEVGQLGYNFALNIAPHYTGALKAAILLEFPNGNVARIISSRPYGDKLPIHVMFDEGIYPNPRINSSLGFMKQTALFLETEFSRRLKLAITRSIEKVGSVK